MNFIKALISWKLWLAILLGIGLLVGLWLYTFNFLEEYTNHGVEVEVPNLSELTIQDAMAKLDELHLSYEIDSVKYTDEYPPYAVLDFYPQEGAKVKPGRRVFIKSNPSTWAPIELPDLMDKSKRLAITLLNMRGFALGDTIYVKDPARDAVLGMLHDNDTVRAGDMLDRGAKIDLILGRGYRMDMPVPEVVGLSLEQAKSTLKNQFFDLGQIYFLGETQDTIGAKVVYQDPPGLDEYDEGLPVSLWVSSKSSAELAREIDSLNIQYRRRIDEKDSLFYNSIKSSEEIDIRDFSEEIRNAIKYDQNTNEEMRRPVEQKKSNKPTIDTAGISIH